MKATIMALLFVLLFSSCAKKANVTYTSDPPGAELREDNRVIGYAPMTFTYTWNNSANNGCTTTKAIIATWKSGASVSNSDDRMLLCHQGSFEKHFERPVDAVGVEEDIVVARKIMNDREINRQNMVAAQEAARARLLTNMIQTTGNTYSEIQNAKTNSYASNSTCPHKTWTVNVGTKSLYCTQDIYCNTRCF